ncbi:RNA-binding protein [Mycobacterium sp.]|uniref:RNA-binding protein n=1 Tax=Mycobacterium sp. TaxID=1785 RepID=UPI002D8396D5|nr:RNA-binding protein [Mycobacterium sp.]
MRRIWVCSAALIIGAVVVPVPPAQATVCGSVGGRHVDISGCADPFYELNDVLAPPPPPPPPPGAPPPPPPPPPPVYVPPLPNVDVCANVGRRISVSGCI